MKQRGKEISVTLPPRVLAWLELQRKREDKTESAMIRKCVINYLGHRFGKEKILTEDPHGAFEDDK